MRRRATTGQRGFNILFKTVTAGRQRPIGPLKSVTGAKGVKGVVPITQDHVRAALSFGTIDPDQAHVTARLRALLRGGISTWEELGTRLNRVGWDYELLKADLRSISTDNLALIIQYGIKRNFLQRP